MKRLLLSLAPSALLLALPAPAEVIERVVAKVNGDIVTLTEFTARQVQAAQAARVTPERIESFLRENNARILQEAIDDLLILQKGADLGIRLRPEYIREVLDGIKKENNLETEEAFQEALRREGMTLDDLKRNIERSIVTRQVLGREVDSKIQVSDAEALKEYEARRADYSRPASVRLQEIVVRGPEASETARGLIARVRAGEDFAALARAHSSAATRDAGGDLGRIAHGELAPEIEKIAFGLAPGAVSEPIPVPDGYRLLRLVERNEAGVVPYDEAKAELVKQLGASRRAEAYKAFVEGLRKSAIVDIRVREVPLQVNLQSSGSLLEPLAEMPGTPRPTVPKPAERPRAADEEFATSPQARPERVAPPGARPSPSPTPTPPPPGR
jgi:parvulin-like peptidyl-prolyl isomerase